MIFTNTRPHIKKVIFQTVYIKQRMQIPEEKTYFHQKADTFDLTVILQNDRLNITLKDCIDWIIYSNDYTKDNIGTEIHQKINLLDVYTAFQQSRLRYNEQSGIQGENEFFNMKRYEFGTTVENEGSSCYKIEKKGKITVYFGIIDRRTKKPVIYQSTLILKNPKNMTQMEIIDVKVEIEKNRIFTKLYKKIEYQQQEKQVLFTKIVHLEEENSKFKKTITQLTQTSQQLTDRIQQSNEQFVKLQQKFSQLMQQLKHQSHNNSGKLVEMEQLMKPIRIARNLHSFAQINSAHFKVDGLRVQYISPNAGTQYIFNMPIQRNSCAKFKLKISHMTDRDIFVGVVDYNKQKDQRSSWNSGNAMCYFSHDGRKYPENVKEGDGFKQGDIVEIDVDRTTKTIKYFVNGVHKATHSNEMLADNNRVFMPYVDMYLTNDAVEWLL